MELPTTVKVVRKIDEGEIADLGWKMPKSGKVPEVIEFEDGTALVASDSPDGKAPGLFGTSGGVYLPDLGSRLTAGTQLFRVVRSGAMVVLHFTNGIRLSAWDQKVYGPGCVWACAGRENYRLV